MPELNDYIRSEWHTGDIIDEIKMNNIESQIDAITDNIRDGDTAKVFNASKIYKNGDHCLYNGELYLCITDMDTPGEWTGDTNWKKAYVGEEIAALNNTITYSTGATPLVGWIEGKKINVGGTTVQSVKSDPDYRYLAVPCQEGDIFTINAQGQSAYRVYAFANGNEILKDGKGPENATLRNYIVQAPPNSTTLYINDVIDGGVSFRGTPLTARVNNIEAYEQYLPRIIKFDELITEAGGIYESTHIVRNVSSYKHTKPIAMAAGEKVIAYLTGSRAYSLISVYSSDEISADTYLTSIVGKTPDVAGTAGKTAAYFEFTADEDCYIVFTCHINGINSGNAQAFFIKDYDSGNRIQDQKIRQIEESFENNDNLVESTMIMHEKTCVADGRIITKESCEVTGTIPCSQNEVFTLQVWNATYASVCFYTSPSDELWAKRIEFTSVNFKDEKLNTYFECPADVSAFRVCIDNALQLKEGKISVKRGAVTFGEYIDGPLSRNVSVKSHIIGANHRGWHHGCPENCIISFIKSKEHGFSWIENDVRFTSDGVGVLLHDESINRTARNADGTEISTTINIADITYEQALTYDFGIYAGDKYAGTKICTLEECIQICRKLDLGIILEPKVSGHADYIVNLVNKYNMADKVIYTSFNSTAIKQISNIVPAATVGLTRNSIDATFIDNVKSLKNGINTVYACIDYTSEITDEVLAELQEESIKLSLYTVNDLPTILNNNLPDYVSEITSDFYPVSKIIAINELLKNNSKPSASIAPEEISTIDSINNISTKINELKTDITSQEILGHASGAIAHFSDGAAESLRALTVQIEPVQDLNGYDYPWPIGGGKNKLLVNASTQTINGVTFTVNPDGTIKCTGTATDTAIFYPSNNWAGENGVEYILSGCPADGGTNTKYKLDYKNGDTFIIDSGSGASFVSSEVAGNVRIVIYAGYGNGLLFKPMIRLASETDVSFAPYSNICPITGWNEIRINQDKQNLFNKLNNNSINAYIDVFNSKLIPTEHSVIFYMPCIPNVTYTAQMQMATNNSVISIGFSKQFPSIDTKVLIGKWVTKLNGAGSIVSVSAESPADAKYVLMGTDQYSINTLKVGINSNNEYNITLPLGDNTVYGGTIDIINGLLTVTKAAIDLGTLNWTLRSSANSGFRTTDLTNHLLTSGINYQCSNYKAIDSSVALAAMTNGSCKCSPTDSSYFYVCDSRFSNATDLKNALSGVQLIYELATPITYSLSPLEIRSILGENYFWANTGDVNVTYKKDITLYVDNASEKNNIELFKTVKENLTKFEPYEQARWTQGSTNPVTGAITTSDTNITLKSSYFFGQYMNIVYIEAISGYQFTLIAYQEDGTLIGAWNGSSFEKTNEPLAITYAYLPDFNNFKYKISLSKTDGSSIAVEEYNNIEFWKYDKDTPYMITGRDRILNSLKEKSELGNLVVIGFNTDQHIWSGNKYSVLNGLKVLSQLTHKYPYDFICLGGDACEAGAHSTSLKDILDNCIEIQEPLYDANCPVIPITGNHDAAQNNSAMTGEMLFNAHFKRICNTGLLKGWDSAHTNGYWDSEAHKIRFIFFDDTTRADYTSVQRQNALSSMLNGTPEDYKIVIFSHHALSSALTDSNGWANKIGLQNILEPFSSKIICCICGHSHRDISEVQHNILFIATTMAACGTDAAGNQRSIYTEQETAFDTFVIDQNNMHIYALRYGYGENRDWTYTLT